MYRHLREFIHWKDKFRVEIVNIVFVLILIVGCIDCVKCSENLIKTSSKIRSVSGRAAFEHGLFRHDKPRDSASTFPVKSDTDSSNIDVTQRTRCQSAQDCQQPQSNIYLPTDSDKRNRYTYERFKRSVTTLNFHPKPRNESKNVGVKPLRIFKYITEDDMLLKPSSETHHVTIFEPIVNAANNKAKTSKSIKFDPSSSQKIDNTSRQQVVAGTKVNHKAKLDETSGNVIKSNNSDSKSKLQHNSSKALSSSAPKPNQNILIFKPSLIIRKNNNKTSLIPSGNHATKYSNFNQGSGNIKPSSITAATNVATHSKESTDPNSSTVNDRSLIHNNVYFDSVVTLSAEGQKQLLHHHHQTVEAHREKGRKSSGNNENKYDDDDDYNKADEIKKSITPTPSSSFSLKSNLNSNSGIDVDSKNKKHKNNHNEKKISPSLPVTNIKPNVNKKKGSGSTAQANTKQRSSSSGKATTDLVKALIHEINATIAGNNKDKVIVKVGKSKKSKNSKKSKKLQQPKLDEDDDEQDGSERSRRSPFKVPIKFQHPNNNMYPRFSPLTQIMNNGNQQNQLARAALFRRNPVMTTRMRKGPIITKKVFPRVLTPVSHLPMPGKYTLARTILPMKPMPMMSFGKPAPKQGAPTVTLGPGPVGPPIAAIKVTTLNALNKGNEQKTNQNVTPNQVLNGKDSVADASKMVYSYRPMSKDLQQQMNQAASSYYSPTYKRFKNRFHDQISSIMDSQRELEDQIAQNWDESRFPNREGSKHRLRNASVRYRDRPRHHHPNERERHRDRHERPRERERERPHHQSSHRSGQHGQHHRHGPHRGKKLGPKYTYPKNAESIQDILKYFDKEAPPNSMGLKSSFEKQGTTNPDRQQSILPADGASPSAHPKHSKLADLSGEFRDVHASLLKDIREFAKRPNLFKPGSSHSDNPNSPYSNENSGSPFEAIDELFGPKPKPVRDLIKPDLYSLENIRERIALKKGKLHGKFTDKDKNKHSYYDHEEEHQHHSDNHRNSVPDIEEIDGFYDSHRPSRHNTDDDGQSAEAVKNSLFSKEDFGMPPSYNKREKSHKSNDDSHTIFPTSHFHDDKETIKENKNPFELQSAEFTKEPPQYSPPKPVILKRPNEPFRVREAEPKKKPEHDYFWNTFANGFEKSPSMNYNTPLVLKSPQTPSVLQPYNPYGTFGHAAAPLTHTFPKSASAEEEDIVEIHTGGPGGSSYTSNQNNFKQEKLKKLYMDVLQQKMQLEAALMHPAQGHAGMMHHLNPSMQGMHGMHSSASMVPQHNPLQVSRMAPSPQGTNFHGTSVTFHGNQGANFPGTHGTNFHGNPGGAFSGAPGANFPSNFPGNLGSNFPGNNFAVNPGSNFPGTSGATFPGAPTATFPQYQGMPSVTRRKKPMRMKIHIYPNGNGNDAIEQGMEAANLLASGGFGTSGFSASNPTSVVAPPPPKNSVMGKQSDSAILSGPTGPHPTSPSGFGGTSLSGPMGGTAPAKSNKNVVLHLHVHRRNDNSGLELETEGSAPVPVTAKPLTYKEIFDEQMKKSEQQRNSHHSNHRDAEEEEETSQSVRDQEDTQEAERNEDSERGERDKSVSMEVPIHDDKIEDVFHTIMKFRKKPDDRKKRS